MARAFDLVVKVPVRKTRGSFDVRARFILGLVLWRITWRVTGEGCAVTTTHRGIGPSSAATARVRSMHETYKTVLADEVALEHEGRPKDT